jgi:pimeloyl-ACP methyl ester carboxylesterase
MSFLTLPRLHWGDPGALKRALMVHGLGSSAQTCWQVMEAVADNGWSATAVDLRGHGGAPRAKSYRIADFASDLVEVKPEGATTGWDLVIGHSIGAASAVVASTLPATTNAPVWAKKLVLLDPALALDDAMREMVLENQRLGHSEHGIVEVTALYPHWHHLDIELKVHAHRQASLFALEHAVFDNDPWDVTREALMVSVPTLVLGAEEDRGSMFCGEYATDMLAANSHFSYQVIEGAGHSVHRDKPAQTIAAILGWLT